MRHRLLAAIFLTLSALFAGSAAGAREVTDMAGRKVTVPDVIRRVYSSAPPATYLVYALDPSLLAAVNFPPREEERALLRPEYLRLPVAGGIFGQGRLVNQEALLALKPDLVVFWGWKDGGANERFAEATRKAGLSAVSVDLDRLERYPEALLFLGDLLNRKERAEKLAAYGRETLRSVAAAVARRPLAERPAVYYAEGPDGLATEREDSVHAQLIGLAGGRNVHRGDALDHMGMEKVSLEQVLLYNPEVIVAQERAFYDAVWKDPRWQGIRAVKEKRVYLIPHRPFNWFDRPPSFMRFLGLKWLANALDPKRYPLDLAAETKAFYRVFLGLELSDRDVKEIVGP